VGGFPPKASRDVRALLRRQGREPEPEGWDPHFAGGLRGRAPVALSSWNIVPWHYNVHVIMPGTVTSAGHHNRDIMVYKEDFFI